MLFVCLSTQINLPHVFKMSAFVMYMHYLSGVRHWSIDASIVLCSMLCHVYLHIYIKLNLKGVVNATKYHNNVTKTSVSE